MNTLERSRPAPTTTRRLATAAAAAALVLAGTAARAQEVPPAVHLQPAAMPAAPAPVHIVAPAPSPWARVLSVTPHVERHTETRQQCTEQVQQVTTPGQAGLGATLAGSLIGGAIASPIGKGSGKAVAVVTGSAIGAHLARQAAEQQTTTTNRTVQVCQPVNVVREVVREYAVRYEWEGREYVATMAQPPGPWLKVTTSHSVQVY